MPLRIPNRADYGKPKLRVLIINPAKVGKRRTKKAGNPTANFSIIGCSSAETARRKLIGLINRQNVQEIRCLEPTDSDSTPKR